MTTLIYPFLTQYADKITPDDIDDDDILALSLHLSDQISYQIKNHGFNVDSSLFSRDKDFMTAVIESLIRRTVDKHHSLQDFIDEIVDGEDTEDMLEIVHSE